MKEIRLRRMCYALTIVLSMAFATQLLCLSTTKAFAEDVAKDGAIAEVIHFIGEDGGDATIEAMDCTDAEECVQDGACHFTDGWYIVTHWMHLTKRAEVEGDVKIILCDGATLEHFSGMHVGEGSKLSIYCQDGRTGALVAGWNGQKGCAGIGGNDDEDSGEIYIYGGCIEAKGGEDGAGIGGGAHGCCTRFEMLDGDVTATALSYTPSYHGIDEKCEKMQLPGGGAGVGGGAECAGGVIRIHGGKLTATGGTYFGLTGGAGIGGGGEATTGDVEIDGGEVHAKGACGAAGIGSSMHQDSEQIIISDCTVEAQGGNEAAGIGGGLYGKGGYIGIANADVTATGVGGAGIGGGSGAPGGYCIVEGGTVRATSKLYRVNESISAKNASQGAAIGSGDHCGGDEVHIEGDARVICSVEDVEGHAGCIGHGKSAHEESRVFLYGGACVNTGDSLTDADDRIEALVHGHEATIEPCAHEQVTYEPNPAGHIISCAHCAAFANREPHAHEFGEDGHCDLCGYERPIPRFTDVTLCSDGELGLVFWLEARDFGEFDYGDTSVEVFLQGRKARSRRFEMSEALRSGDDRYGFFMPLSYIEMAEPVTAVFQYGEGVHLEMASSMRRLIEERIGSEDIEPATAIALKMLANAGHYPQPWLSRMNGWKQNEYAVMDLFYPELCDVSGARAKCVEYEAAITAANASGEALDATFGIKKVRCSLALDSLATLRVTVDTAATPESDSYRAEFADQDHEVTSELSEDDVWRASVKGLKPADFGKPLTLSFEVEGVTYKVSLSALSYVQALLGDEAAPVEAGQAAASLYWLSTQGAGIEHLSR